MATDTLTGALEKAAEPKETASVRDLLDRLKPEIERALCEPDAAERIMRYYLTAIRYSPPLRQCTAESLAAACLISAQVNLEPGPIGYVYFIPRGTECVWMMGYTGIIEQARRSGASGLRSTIVWDCDRYVAPWENERGLHWELKSGAPADRKERVAVLVAWKADGLWQAIDVPADRIERAKNASPAFKARSGPWLTDEDAMWRKTGVRAARPFLPMSPQFAQAVSADDAIVHGIEVVEQTAQPILEAAE